MYRLIWDLESAPIPLRHLRTFRAFLSRKGIEELQRTTVFANCRSYQIPEDLSQLDEQLGASITHSDNVERDIQKCVVSVEEHMRPVILAGFFRFDDLGHTATNLQDLTFIMPFGVTCDFYYMAPHRHHLPSSWRSEQRLHRHIQSLERLDQMEEQKERKALDMLELCKASRRLHRQAIWESRNYSECSEDEVEHELESEEESGEEEETDGQEQEEEAHDMDAKEKESDV